MRAERSGEFYILVTVPTNTLPELRWQAARHWSRVHAMLCSRANVPRSNRR